MGDLKRSKAEGLRGSAKTWYNLIKNYNTTEQETGKHCFSVCNGMVDIRRHGDTTNEIFTLFASGDVLRYVGHNLEERLKIEDLTGTDYEYYSPVQTFRAGYFVFDTNSEKDVKVIISRLCKYIESFENIPHDDEPIPSLVGGVMWMDNLTDNFTYHATNGIEINISTIRSFCKTNFGRSIYGVPTIPYNKTFKNENAIRVDFSTDIKMHNINDITDNVSDALADLKKYLVDIDVEWQWHNLTLRKPICH